MNDNYRTLFDFYTSRGATPAGAAGLLAQIYEESRGNPRALNPDDGGLPSFGMMQWRGPRNSQLRTFAAARGKSADDLITQAEFSLMELEGDEKRARRFLQAESPEEAGLGFANEFIRPAKQHRAVRGPLARAFYEHFVNNVPLPEAIQRSRMSSPLSFDPAIGNMPDTTEGVMAQELQQRLNEGRSPSDILQEIMELGSPPEEELLEPIVPDQPVNYQEEVSRPVFAMGLEGHRPDQMAPMAPPNVGELPIIPGQDSPVSRGLNSVLASLSPEMLAEGMVEEALDEQLPPDPETGEPASAIVNQAIPELGEGLAFELGIPVEQVPRTLNETVRAANDETPEEEDPERYRRRMLAAEMLQALSIGLGQISAGQAVNLSSVFEAQRAYRASQAERAERAQAAMAKQQQEAQALQERMMFAQQLQEQGMPELARMAAISEEGYNQAISVFGSLQKAQLTPTATSGLSQPQRQEVLIAAGVDPDTAALVSQFPDLTETYMRELTLPSEQSSPNEGRINEVQSLISSALPYTSRDPRVGPAIQRAMANPESAEAASNLQAILNDVAPEAYSLSDIEFTPEQLDRIAQNEAIADNPVLQDLIRAGGERGQQLANQVFSGQLEAAAKGMEKGAEEQAQLAARRREADQEAVRVSDNLVSQGLFTRSEGKIVSELGADRGLEFVLEQRKDNQEQADRARINELARAIGQSYNNPEAQQLFANVQTAQELRDAIGVADTRYSPPGIIREAEFMRENPEAREAILEYVMAKAGVRERLTPVQTTLLDQVLSETTSMAEDLAIRRGLVNSMKGLLELISADGYSHSGPLSSTVFQQAQNILTDLFGDSVKGLLRDEQEGFGTRVLAAMVGEYFQSFRPPGSGAVSDFESRNFIAAMPNITDPVIRQQGLAQRIIRGFAIAEKQLQAQQDYLLANQDNPDALLDRAAMASYVDNAVAESGLTLFPALNVADVETMTSYIDDQINRGQLDDKTVIRAEGLGGEPVYMTFREFKQRIGL